MQPRLAATIAGTALLALVGAAPAVAQDPDWPAQEAQNYAITTQAPLQQASDPAFLERLESQSLANIADFAARQLADPAWRTTGNLCETWAEQCAGDPYRYPGVDPFYDDAVVEPVAFLDRGGARLSGRIWAPAPDGTTRPGVVIVNGSVQAPETLYWWAAQALVRSGYVVMTFDPRGQGRSDNSTPDGEQGSNANPDVFVTNTVDAIDFFRSTPAAPYTPNDGDARATTSFNPLWDRIDPERLGAVGHSLGATGVSIVQGIEPWPGSHGAGIDGTANPIDVIVAWDNLSGAAALAGFEVTPRVPAMGQSADYGLAPVPNLSAPDPDAKLGGFDAWVDAGLPAYQLVIRGGTHYEWSLIPTFPTSAWEAGGPGGWGRPLAEHWTLAWLDRWLAAPGDPGHDDADARLLAEDESGPDDATWRDRLSYLYRSARSFPDRGGAAQTCDDILAGCPAATPAPVPSPTPTATPVPDPVATPADDVDESSSELPVTGSSAALLAIGLMAAGRATRRR